MSNNAISEYQAVKAAQQAADEKLIRSLSPADPAYQAAADRHNARRHQAELEAAAAAKVTAERRFIDQVRAYATSVKAAVGDAAKVKPGPVTPTARGLARQMLHSRDYPGLAAAPGHLDPAMASLLAVVMQGQSLIYRSETGDPIVLEQLSQAEAEAWSALIQRAKLVAGEVAV